MIKKYTIQNSQDSVSRFSETNQYTTRAKPESTRAKPEFTRNEPKTNKTAGRGAPETGISQRAAVPRDFFSREIRGFMGFRQ